MAYQSKAGVPFSASFVTKRPGNEALGILVSAARAAGARPVSTGSGFQIRNRYMPDWVKGLGIVLVIGTFGIGVLLLLLVRKTDILNASVTQLPEGVLVSMTGAASPHLCDALQKACAELQAA